MATVADRGGTESTGRDDHDHDREEEDRDRSDADGQDEPLITKPEANITTASELPRSRSSSRNYILALLLAATILVAVHVPSLLHPDCSSQAEGYNCHLPVSHLWGQYSPYFSVQSDIKDSLPRECKITFAQALSRHGARFPTTHKSEAYRETIQQLLENVESFPRKYSFLAHYRYDLGSDDLTTFGQQQMIESGAKFYKRYQTLAKAHTPFFRASSSSRVIVSAQNFTQGFHNAKEADGTSVRLNPGAYPYRILQISEADGSNNTLDHGTCTAFENGRYDSVPTSADSQWKAKFVSPIRQRLNGDLGRANLTEAQVVYLMDLCPFSTVATSGAKRLSPFCNIFSLEEWKEYNYLQSLDKYYSYGSGNPLGPSQGVGFANELIARMTKTPVADETSTNHTLDSEQATFPIGEDDVLFADFSHDTQMISILSALGVYNATVPLPDSRIGTAEELRGYSAAWTVPFGARIYFEKMECDGEDGEFVRILVNDRVIPLQNCGTDEKGRCKLDAWVESLSFARHNGRWDQCFLENPHL